MSVRSSFSAGGRFFRICLQSYAFFIQTVGFLRANRPSAMHPTSEAPLIALAVRFAIPKDRQWSRDAMLEKFPRYPLTFGPTPIEKLERLVETSRRRGRDLRQARRLQFRPGLRRQQDPQARIHRARRHRLGRRHAGHDRRRPVQPYAPGRGDRRQDRHEMPAGPGKLGAVRGRRLRPGRQHIDEPRHGRRDRAGRRGFRHRHPRELGARARRRQGEGRQALRRSRPALRCIRSAGSAMSASPRRCARRRRRSASASTTSWSARSPARPMPAWSSASPRTGASAT